jgi:hypothetical protein
MFEAGHDPGTGPRMTGTVFGPARCRDCGAVWQVVHVTLAAEGCIRCGGTLEEVAHREWSLHMRRGQLARDDEHSLLSHRPAR